MTYLGLKTRKPLVWVGGSRESGGHRPFWRFTSFEFTQTVFGLAHSWGPEASTADLATHIQATSHDEWFL